MLLIFYLIFYIILLFSRCLLKWKTAEFYVVDIWNIFINRGMVRSEKYNFLKYILKSVECYYECIKKHDWEIQYVNQFLIYILPNQIVLDILLRVVL